MKSVASVTVSVAALFLGTSVLAGAQNGRSKDHEGGNPHHQEGNVHQHEGGHPSPSSHGNHQPHEAEYRHQQARESHESVRRIPEHRPYGGQLHEVRRSEPVRYERQDIWQRQRAHNWQREHHAWHERGGYHGYRIPEDRFRGHFGRGHWFRVHDVPVVVVQGAPRFQFGGFWFDVVDPCPETWSPVWYRTDEVYVDYVNDGYYMYNRRHPGIAIAVNVSL
jgi:hypothetical protein